MPENLLLAGPGVRLVRAFRSTSLNPVFVALTGCVLVATSPAARADDAAPAPAGAAPAAPATVTLSTPSMAGPLVQNPHPYTLDAGALGNWYVTGALTGLGIWQDNPSPRDKHTRVDLDNGQVFIQKTDGLVQFYVQAGAYTVPAIGTAYVPVTRDVGELYGAVPQAFIKLAPTDNFSIEAGKLPTLIGGESTFTFENLNIERGLLWNQTNAVNRGVQVNYTIGKVAVSVSLNDGFYSDRLNWLSGEAAWTISSSSTLTAIASGNFSHTAYSSYATPLAQDNSQIYDLIYAYSSGPWTVTPYVQASVVPRNLQAGISKGANTYGAALLANYAFTPNLSLGVRGEYILSTGKSSDGAPSLIYGAGSKAWAITVTPTYQVGRFFVRADAAYVRAASIVPGDALGPSGNSRHQVRGLLETGVLF